MSTSTLDTLGIFCVLMPEFYLYQGTFTLWYCYFYLSKDLSTSSTTIEQYMLAIDLCLLYLDVQIEG